MSTLEQLRQMVDADFAAKVKEYQDDYAKLKELHRVDMLRMAADLAAKDSERDPAMAMVAALWHVYQQTGMTMQELGEAMGYPEASARKTVHQFLKSRDPRISMLRKFAKAIGSPLGDIIAFSP